MTRTTHTVLEAALIWVLTVGLAAWLLGGRPALAAPGTVTGAAQRAADVTAGRDPFAPPGHARVRVTIRDRAALAQLLRLGFRPEDGDRDHLNFLVDARQRELLEELGFEVEAVRGGGGGDEAALFTTYDQLTADLAQLALDHPALTELVSSGQSVQGRQIWAIEISRNAGIEEVEPEVRLVGAHHGNEKMSVEMNLRMAHYLLENYGSDPTVTGLVDDLEIWIVPMMNPDGVTANSRYNAHGIDLNRNYGYMWEHTSSSGATVFSEPESRAIQALATDNWFSLSLSFHTSGDIVNSVWNYSPHYTEDDDVVWLLTESYASFNGYWAVRGWYWYETHGDCNDYSYGARGDLDWTIEVANSNEPAVWDQNRNAMLFTMAAARWGVHGVVTDAVSGAPMRARVWVEGRGWPAFTDPVLGDFHKVLLPGTYTLRIAANGYADAVVPGVVVPSAAGVTVDVQLAPGGGHYADRVEQANIADPQNTYDNLTLSMAVLGAPDGSGCSLGRGGDVVLDLGPGSAVTDGPGDDVAISESGEDGQAEGFVLYGGASFLGPWTEIGAGAGSAAFDLAGSGLAEARYLRVADDGDGSATGANPGYELDAVEVLSVPTTAVADPGGGRAWPPRPAALALGLPGPNPVRAGGQVAIDVALPAGWAAAAATTLRLYTVGGRLVRTVAAGPALAAAAARGGRLRWAARDARGRQLPAGVYLLELSARRAAASSKILVVP